MRDTINTVNNPITNKNKSDLNEDNIKTKGHQNKNMTEQILGNLENSENNTKMNNENYDKTKMSNDDSHN